ncbi:MAG: hypothetical protein LIO96_04855 [Lachnospiraceae bacterium]|nr:hypothetical protein [Lachnospiraceae bacterium]
MEYREANNSWGIDVRNSVRRFLPSTELNGQTLPRKTEERIGDLLKRYHDLKEQRNKVMHATGENLDVYEINRRMVKFVSGYEKLLECNASYDFSLRRPLNER